MKHIAIAAIAILLLSGCSPKETFEVNRGINVAHWLSQSSSRGEARDGYFTDKDIAFIAGEGFDHIRIPIDEEQMFDEQGNKDPEAFALLHRAIDGALAKDLRVIVDLHILRSHHFNASRKPLFTEKAAQDAFYDCWRKISGELKEYPVSRVAYELMNEPVADDPEDWNRIAGECYNVVRGLEPDRVIVIGSNRWQSIDTVKDLKVPEGDPNIMLSFHFYQPFLLTHYKASWTSQKGYDGPVHYPGTIVTAEELEATGLDDATINTVRHNAGKSYDVESMRNSIAEAVEIARAKGLRIYCGEYGCMANAPQEDRLRWHRDMEDIFDGFGIGRALWCYREGSIGFGILKTDEPDRPMLDAMFGRR